MNSPGPRASRYFRPEHLFLIFLRVNYFLTRNNQQRVYFDQGLLKFMTYILAVNGRMSFGSEKGGYIVYYES